MATRTSLTHPLQIAEVTAPGAKGAIGITFCPGKVQPAAMSGAWDRDLGLDLDAIRHWGASTVITLIEHHEMKELRVQAISADVAARGMDVAAHADHRCVGARSSLHRGKLLASRMNG